jgi:hypothetical protein
MATLCASASALAAPTPAPTDETRPAADAPRRRVTEPPPAAGERKPPPDRAGDPGDPSKPPPEAIQPPADGAGTPKEMTPPIQKKNLSHRLQVSVDIAVGVGAAFIFTYKDTVWCGKGSPDLENDSVCTGLAPVFIDFGLGFGVLDALEILAELRLGLMNDMVGNRPLMVMPGLRLWVDPKLPFKIGLAFQMVIDLTRQDSPEQQLNLPEKGRKLDLGARFYAQIQYDFLRYVGLFGRVGVVGTFQKWVGFNLEAQLGIQARFP